MSNSMQDDLDDLLSHGREEKVGEALRSGADDIPVRSASSASENAPESQPEESLPVISLAERLKLNRLQQQEEFHRDLRDVIENDPRLKRKIILFGIGIVVLLVIFAFLVTRPGKEKVTITGNLPSSTSPASTAPVTENDQDKVKEAQDVNDKLRVDNLAVIARAAAVYHLEQKADLPVSPDYVRLNEDNPVSEFLKDALTRYENSASVLLDPKNPDYYYAYKSADGRSFEISARLENESGKYCQLGTSPCIYKEVVTEAKMAEMSADLESYK